MNSKTCNYQNIGWSKVRFHWQRPRQRPIKMACIEFCGGAHTAQTETDRNFHRVCTHVTGIVICIGLGLGVG